MTHEAVLENCSHSGWMLLPLNSYSFCGLSYSYGGSHSSMGV